MKFKSFKDLQEHRKPVPVTKLADRFPKKIRASKGENNG